MKALLFTLIMLFSSSVIASNYPEDQTSEQLAEFVETHIAHGLALDRFVFKYYVDMVFARGHPVENISVAIRFVHCSIMWRQVLALVPEDGDKDDPNDPHLQARVKSGIWRAIQAAELHTFRAEGQPERVTTHMVPMLVQLELFSGKGLTDVNSANIQSCTALDLTIYNDLMSVGRSPFPPEEWILEPMPTEVPEDAEPEEIGQQPNQIGS